jgi:hypothetical protein
MMRIKNMNHLQITRDVSASQNASRGWEKDREYGKEALLQSV